MPHDNFTESALPVILAIVAGIALGLLAFATMAVGPSHATNAPAPVVTVTEES